VSTRSTWGMEGFNATRLPPSVVGFIFFLWVCIIPRRFYLAVAPWRYIHQQLACYLYSVTNGGISIF
jgi:hypothetical protein